MNQPPDPSPKPATPWARRLVVLGTFSIASVFIWSRLPKQVYRTDLSGIGKGQAALVLTVDGNFMIGAEMLKVLDGVRPDFAGSVQFLVASMGLPEGQAFSRRHQTSDGTVVVLDAGGRPVAVLHPPRTPEELRQALQQALGR